MRSVKFCICIFPAKTIKEGGGIRPAPSFNEYRIGVGIGALRSQIGAKLFFQQYGKTLKNLKKYAHDGQRQPAKDHEAIMQRGNE